MAALFLHIDAAIRAATAVCKFAHVSALISHAPVVQDVAKTISSQLAAAPMETQQACFLPVSGTLWCDGPAMLSRLVCADFACATTQQSSSCLKDYIMCPGVAGRQPAHRRAARRQGRLHCRRVSGMRCTWPLTSKLPVQAASDTVVHRDRHAHVRFCSASLLATACAK